MFKFTIIIIILVLIYTLDKLYLLPLYVPLDTKPDSRRSATYLAKTIAKKAKCEDIWLLDIDYNQGDTVLHFDCNFFIGNYITFYIHVFLNDTVRNEWLKKRNEDTPTSYHDQCFKKGPAYMVCEDSSSTIQFPFEKNKSINQQDSKQFPFRTEKTEDRPKFQGQKYYNQFPGETIEYTQN